MSIADQAEQTPPVVLFPGVMFDPFQHGWGDLLGGFHPTQAGVVATQTRAGAMQGRYTIVVDDVIDIYDLEDVLWAVCTRSRPDEMDFIKKTWSSDTDPTIWKPAYSMTTSRGIIYAVRPWEWRDDFPKVDLATVETRTRVFKQWKNLFGERWKRI